MLLLLLLLLLVLLLTLFADSAELRAKFRSGAVKRRANVGENALLKLVALAFADVIPVVAVDEPFSFELWITNDRNTQSIKNGWSNRIWIFDGQTSIWDYLC